MNTTSLNDTTKYDYEYYENYEQYYETFESEQRSNETGTVKEEKGEAAALMDKKKSLQKGRDRVKRLRSAGFEKIHSLGYSFPGIDPVAVDLALLLLNKEEKP